MKIFQLSLMFIMIITSGCIPSEQKLVLPDLQSHFSALLARKDSALLLDSFYFVQLDTMTEKKELIHQRYSYIHIMENIDRQLHWVSNKQDSFHLVPSANDIESIEYLKGEKNYVEKEIDSINALIAHADSIVPKGFRALYKTTVSKKDKFTISDTVPYAISVKMKVSDWDRNLEKVVDSLAVGKKTH